MTLRCSSLRRISECPGSYHLMQAHRVNSEGEAALEGSRVHAVAEFALRVPCHPTMLTHKHQIRRWEEDGVQKSEEFEVTPAHIENAAFYFDWVQEVLEPVDFKAKLYIEAHMKKYGLSGTSDLIMVADDASWVWVVDYKNGMGYVDHYDNLQLAAYAIMAYEKLDGLNENTELKMSIVQPNSWGQKVRTVNAGSFAEFYRENAPKIERIVEKGLNAHDRLTTGFPWADYYKAGDHCQWCNHGHLCPLAEQAIDELLEGNLTPEKQLEIFEKSDAIKEAIRCVGDAIVLRHEEGKLPNYHWVERRGRGSRVWADKQTVIEKLTGDIFDLEDIFELKSPAEVEKSVPKHLKGPLQKLIVSIPGKPTKTLVKKED